VYLALVATNSYGDSLYSSPHFMGAMKLVPDAPILLANDSSATSATQIRFTWSPGASDGGLPVLFYTVYYD
jgi:hypothetical protein